MEIDKVNEKTYINAFGIEIETITENGQEYIKLNDLKKLGVVLYHKCDVPKNINE